MLGGAKLHLCYVKSNLFKNGQTVKKGCVALCKKAKVKKVVKYSVAAKKWLQW